MSAEPLPPGAREVHTDLGPTWVVETRRTLDELHGGVRLDALRGPASQALATLAGDDLAADADLGAATFLDVESTGLGAGAGTYAFLVGLARLTPDGVLLRQHFLRGPEHEPAFVELLSRELEECSLLVTFNGRGFDVPLLHTRFLLQRRSLPVLTAHHLDLLRPARRLWRYHLPSCALDSLEASLLGLQRVDDVPGREVPALYLEYLQTGDSEPLVPVLQHNRTDLLSTMAVAVRLRSLLDPHFGEQPDAPGEWLGLARCCEHLGALDLAEQAYRKAARGPSGGLRSPADHALRHLTRIYKRQQRWDEAETLWREMVQRLHPDGVYPYVELAKLLEHQHHRFEDAREVVDAALQALTAGRLRSRREPHRVKTELLHRLRRLLRRSP